MSTVKELLLHHLTYTFEKEAWQWAAWFGHRAMVEFLLDRGVDLEAVSHNELATSALGAAERARHDDIASLLRSRGAVDFHAADGL